MLFCYVTFYLFKKKKSVGWDIFCQIQVTQTIVHMHTPHPLSFHPIPTAEVVKYKIGYWKIQNTVQKNHKQNLPLEQLIGSLHSPEIVTMFFYSLNLS